MAFHVAPASNPASLAPPSSIDGVLDAVDSSLVVTLEIAGSIEKAAAHFRRSAATVNGEVTCTNCGVTGTHLMLSHVFPFPAVNAFVVYYLGGRYMLYGPTLFTLW